ncbi:MAG: hypothetical protein KF729_36025 [Sandaracinaceae bacterium]|nr:hypothetical protein [Sandaracinaceae bacterium]
MIVTPLVLLRREAAAVEQTLRGLYAAEAPAPVATCPLAADAASALTRLARCAGVPTSIDRESECELMSGNEPGPLDRLDAAREEARFACDPSVLQGWVYARTRARHARRVEAALAHYRHVSRDTVWVNYPEGVGYCPSGSLLDAPAQALHRAVAGASPRERREAASAIWDEANRTPSARALAVPYVRARLPLAPALTADVLDRFGETRAWREEAEELLRELPPPGPRSRPVAPYAPGPAGAEAIPLWIRLEAELRALAIHLRGEPHLPDAWALDLERRRLGLEREGACLSFVGEGISTRPRSDRFCPEGSPIVAARQWLADATQALLASHQEHGAWPAPIEAARMPVDEDRAVPDDAWARHDMEAPRVPGLRAALRAPTAAGAPARALQVAVARRGALEVLEVGLGVPTTALPGQPPETSGEVYVLTAEEVAASGFCLAPCL